MKKENNRLKSIKNKLFFTVSFSSAVIILTLILLNSIILKSFYIYSKIKDVKMGYNEVNTLYNQNAASFDILSTIAMKNNFELIMENENRILEFSSSSKFRDFLNNNKSHILINDNSRIVFADNKVTIRLISYNGINCILLDGKLDNGKKIYIQVPIASIEENVRISNQLLLIMGTIIIIISLIIASLISNGFAKPILQLNEITKKMANLDFSEKYKPTDAGDEINELGSNINKMSSKLETTIKQLRNNNNQLEKDIEEKSKIDEMRKQFISDVSHELKTPIALIQGYSEGLVENVNSDDESRKYYAEVILDESNRMDKLVKQLLELMKIEYGKMEFNDATFNICELINEVIRRCKMISDERKIKIEFKNSKPVYVFADAFYIEQVITNYITNAIKNVKEVYGEKKIVVSIKTNKEKNNVRISVFNTGDTIEEEYIDKIWGRFYKIDESRNRDSGGTGIGLSLVKAIMTNYNAKYGVNNKENGVEFYFEVKSNDFKT